MGYRQIGIGDHMPRGRCHYCDTLRAVRQDGRLRIHKDGQRQCPGSNMSPEATRVKTLVTDMGGAPVGIGNLVTVYRLDMVTRIGTGIITDVTWDHPWDVDRGETWFTVNMVEPMDAGGHVDTGEILTSVRRRRVHAI